MKEPSFVWAVRGFFYPFRGMRFLFQNPRLLVYIAVPVSINAVLFALLAWFLASYYPGLLQQLLPETNTWYWTILFYAALLLVGLVLVLVAVYAFTLIGNIILGPFNDFLSQKVELLYAGTGSDEPFSLRAIFSDSARSLKVEVGKLLLYLGGLIALLVIHCIPVAGSLFYGVLIMLYTLFFLGWEYCDYSMERWKYTFRQKVRTSTANAFAFVGFGSGASLMLFIPLANLMAIPVCAVGATLLFCDLKKEARIPQNMPGQNDRHGLPTQ